MKNKTSTQDTNTELNFTPGEWGYDDGHVFAKEPGRRWNSIARVYDTYDNSGKPECNWKLIVDVPRLHRENKELREALEDCAKELKALNPNNVNPAANRVLNRATELLNRK